MQFKNTSFSYDKKEVFKNLNFITRKKFIIFIGNIMGVEKVH